MDKEIKQKLKKEKEDSYRWEKAKAQVSKMLNGAPEPDWDDKDWQMVNKLFREMKNKTSTETNLKKKF